MPWKETRVEEERLKFIAAWLADDSGWNMRELCDTFGVSRKSGYKWLQRYRAVGVEGDLGAMLDARATAQYKERLAEARQELDEATAVGDLGRVARARHEIEAITEQLTAAYGLGGRPRTAGDPGERVRKAVTNQIRRALDRIAAARTRSSGAISPTRSAPDLCARIALSTG